jgi:hypothetical protein
VLLLDHHNAKAVLLVLHLLGHLVLVDHFRLARNNLKPAGTALVSFLSPGDQCYDFENVVAEKG